MNITLNGQSRDLPGPLDLNGIVEQFCKDKTPVITEVNGAIIHSPQWNKTIIKEGDRIELVSFVGGG